MTQDQRMLQAILEYRADIDDPGPRWPEMEFEKYSYSKWAVDELYIWVLSHPDWTVLHAVSEFVDMMNRYACRETHYSEANFIFEIAWEQAGNIYYILSCME